MLQLKAFQTLSVLRTNGASSPSPVPRINGVSLLKPHPLLKFQIGGSIADQISKSSLPTNGCPRKGRSPVKALHSMKRSSSSSGMLVAMKGHPACGKSTLARSLAKALRWPLLDKDDIRDCTRPLHLALSASPSKHDAGEVLLNTMAYQVLWRLAETQLKMGLSVIVDSPLSRPSLFGSAATLAAAHHCRLIIIECLPSDTQAWRHRLECRVAVSENAIVDVPTPINSDGGTVLPQEDYGCAGWHKPGCWEDLQALIQNYQRCNEYDVLAPARKLVVDTTAPLSADALHAEVLSWLLSVCDSTPHVSYIPSSG